MDDASTLIQKISDGDLQAVTELVERYMPALRDSIEARLIRMGLDRRIQSSSVIDEVWLDFLRRARLGGFLGEAGIAEGNLVGYLSKMAFHDIVDRLRRLARQKTLSLDELPEPPEEARSPEQQLASREEAQRLLQRMTPEEQDRELKLAGGASYEDLDAERGVRPGSTKKAVYRTRRRLRQDGEGGGAR